MTAQVITQTPSPQPNDSAGIINYMSGGFSTDTGTAAAFAINLGFTPRKVRVVNITDVTQYELLDQLPAGDTIKTVTAGTVTLDTGSAIVVSDRTVTFSAGVMLASKSFVWEAWA